MVGSESIMICDLTRRSNLNVDNIHGECAMRVGGTPGSRERALDVPIPRAFGGAQPC